MRKLFILTLALPLMACGNSEKACYDRLSIGLSDQGIMAGHGLILVDILYNPDLDVCDYTLLMGQLVRR